MSLLTWFVNEKEYAAAAIAIVIGIIIIWRLYSNRRRRGAKVTSLEKHKKGRRTKQKCSYCKKKASDLAFYSAGEGRVVGVCRQCRPQAERQALLRI